MTVEDFARHEFQDYTIYSALAKVERISSFKTILEELITHEWAHYSFWRTLSDTKEFRISRGKILLFRLMRVCFGLTFVVKLLEGQEKQAVSNYGEYLKTADAALRPRVLEIIEHEQKHERALIAQINEGKIRFISSIILGMNDGLIELTGALVGFASVFADVRLVALSGFITGVAASLSMASSAYMSARHETDKDPRRAALYTGIPYLIVVLLLIAPFLFMPTTVAALIVMFVLIGLIIAGISYYTSVVLERSFKRQFAQMAVFSVGVALIAYSIGSLIRVIAPGRP